MLRLFLFLGLALVAGGAAAILLKEHQGYVLIEVAGYQLETTLAALVMLLVAALVGLALLWRFLAALFVVPGQLREALDRRRLQRAQSQFQQGMLALKMERWASAERALLKHVSDAPVPALNYLGAAEAAHQQGAESRSEEYLNLAEQDGGSSQAAVAMARARWARDRGDWDAALQAIKTAESVKGHSPQAVQALRLEVLERSEQWAALRSVLPQSLGALPRPQLEALGTRAEAALLQQAGDAGNLEALRDRWLSLPKAQRQDPDLLCVYVRYLHRLGADAEALRLIPPALKQRWHPELARLYGQLHAEDGVAQLAVVEQWLQKHENDPELLTVAGQLAARCRLWGKARSYLESAQRIRPSTEIALALGQLQAQNQDESAALQTYRKGLQMAVQPGPSSSAPALPKHD